MYAPMKHVAISSIKINPNNPRTIKDDKFKKLVASVKELPEMAEVRPIVVNTDMVILGGNMRYQAMKEAGWKDVPVIIVDWDEAKQREFVIKDNVSGGEWDWDMLANEWDTAELEDWGLDLPSDFGEQTEVEEDDAPEVDEVIPPVSVLGEVYQLGRHRLMCADSTSKTDVNVLMNDELADMVFTDPPYGVDYEGINNDDRAGLEKLLTEVFTNIVAVSKPGSAFYCFHSDRCADIFHEVYRKFCHFSSMLIWVKPSLVMGQSDFHSKHEPFMYGWIEGGNHKWYGDRSQTSIWEYGKEAAEGHTTPKPTDLICHALQLSSTRGSNILDLFGGSGSTLIASEKTDRTCYMMELDPKYVDVIRKRYWKFVNNGDEHGWEENTPAIQKVAQVV